MIKKFKIITILFVFLLFCVSIHANTVDSLNTKIIIRDNGVLEIHDFIKIIISNENYILLNIPPVLDLQINSDFKNYSYNFDNNTLYISLNNTVDNNTLLSFEIIYLTDVFSTKKGNDWNISYYSSIQKKLDSFEIILPTNVIINNLSTDYNSIYLNNNQFTIYTKNISNFCINYSLNNLKLDNNNNNNNNNNKWNFLIICIILLIIISTLFLKNKKKKNNIKKNNDLLLGLNENEQKIINLLFVENGISQKKIALRLFLPKGTVSRNITKLKDKGYIKINKYGVTNKVFLGEIFLKK